MTDQQDQPQADAPTPDDTSTAVPFGSTEDEPVDDRADALREQGIMPDLESVRDDVRDEAGGSGERP